MGPAYAVVAAMYIGAFLLTLGVARGSTHATAAHPLADIKRGFSYVWHKPDLLGAFSMAFLVNLLAYPFFLGLLPYVAKDVFAIGQAGLGYLAGAFWSGALIGSMLVGAGSLRLRRARHAVERRLVVRGDPRLRPDHVAPLRPGAALRRRLRSQLLPHAARRRDAALHRGSDARPRDGGAHARNLGPAPRPARGRAI